MRSIGLAVLVVLVGMMVGGCATGPYSPVKSKNLEGAKLIYFEQADRIPKDVMLESWKHLPLNPVPAPVAMGANAQAIPPEVIAAIVAEVLKMIPQTAAGYQNERMNEALLSRRMLFRGYQDAELKDINDIIKSMGWSIEYMTPQNKTVPPPAAK